MSLDTDEHRQVDQESMVTSAVTEIVERRAVIERAKGMLMVVYGIDADAAFQLLRWQSQHHNVKLRLIAEQIERDFIDASTRRPSMDRRTYDELLVTAYTRISSPLVPDAVRYLNERLGIGERPDS